MWKWSFLAACMLSLLQKTKVSPSSCGQSIDRWNIDFFFTGLYGNLDVLCFYPDEKLKGSGGRVRYCRPCRPHGTFDFRSVFENLFFFLNKIAVWTTNVSLNVNMEKKVLIYLQFTFLSMYSPVWRGYVVGRVTYT